MVRELIEASEARPISSAILDQFLLDQLPIAYLEVAADGVIHRCNSAAQAMLAHEESRIVGMHVWSLAPFSQAEANREAFLAIIDSCEEAPAARRTLYAQENFASKS